MQNNQPSLGKFPITVLFYFSSLCDSSLSLLLRSMEELEILKEPTRENTLVGDCLVEPNLSLLIPGEAVSLKVTNNYEISYKKIFS